MRPLFIGEEEQQQLTALREYAKENIVSLTTIMRSMNDPNRAIGNDPRHRIVLPFGYRIVFSMEQQIPGVIGHLSISVDSRPNPDIISLPHEAAVGVIMKEFGMEEIIETWNEPIEDGGGAAINILATLKDFPLTPQDKKPTTGT